ncbi:unnamed protein product [Spodoptera exigua]|nr:unnamed protein product [Spodoptera exigua]
MGWKQGYGADKFSLSLAKDLRNLLLFLFVLELRDGIKLNSSEAADDTFFAVYFSVTIVTMGHFIEMEQRYLTGDMNEPESESFLEPDKITPILTLRRVKSCLPRHGIKLTISKLFAPFFTVSLNITLLACSTIGLVACVLLILGVYKDIKYLLLPWVVAMGMETLVEIINLVYLFYLQTVGKRADGLPDVELQSDYVLPVHSGFLHHRAECEFQNQLYKVKLSTVSSGMCLFWIRRILDKETPGCGHCEDRLEDAVAIGPKTTDVKPGGRNVWQTQYSTAALA